MHGCVNHPSDIVLTRSDYNRYSDRRAALAGIVQVIQYLYQILYGLGPRSACHDIFTNFIMFSPLSSVNAYYQTHAFCGFFTE